MMDNNFFFEKLIPNKEQIEALYNLLDFRVHNISHKIKPPFKDHEFFVRNNPYRSWYLVKAGDQFIGSFYISKQNTIGINIEYYKEIKLVTRILLYVKSHYQPLHAIASVRSGSFAIHVSPSNKFLASTLEKLGSELAQITYYMPNFKN